MVSSSASKLQRPMHDYFTSIDLGEGVCDGGLSAREIG